jgi:branched-chain amino acid transport system permease protein
MSTDSTMKGTYQRLVERLRQPPLSLLLYVVFLGALPFVVGLTLATKIVIFGLFALGFNILFGLSGLLSFGHALFLGTGAFLTGILVTEFGLPILAVLLVVVLVSAVLALFAGLLALRLTGIYFAMITLAFAQLFFELSYVFSGLTGGSDGLGVPRPSLLGLDIVVLQDSLAYYVFTAGVVLAILVFATRLSASTFGRTLRAIRENEERTVALGVNTYRVKVAIFVLSGAVAGVAGALLALSLQYISPNLFFWSQSGDAVLYTLIGGMRTLFGPIAGTFFLSWLEDTLFSTQPGAWNIFLGTVFVIFVLFVRSGLVGKLTDVAQDLAERLDGEKDTADTNPETDEQL